MHSLSQFPVLDKWLPRQQKSSTTSTFVPSAVITVLSSQLLLTIILHFPAFIPAQLFSRSSQLLWSSAACPSVTSQWGLCHLRSLVRIACCHPPIAVLLWKFVSDFFITQSITIANSNGDKMYPCRTPVTTSNQSPHTSFSMTQLLLPLYRFWIMSVFRLLLYSFPFLVKELLFQL